MIRSKASPGWDWLFQDNPTILSRKNNYKFSAERLAFSREESYHAMTTHGRR